MVREKGLVVDRQLQRIFTSQALGTLIGSWIALPTKGGTNKQTSQPAGIDNRLYIICTSLFGQSYPIYIPSIWGFSEINDYWSCTKPVYPFPPPNTQENTIWPCETMDDQTYQNRTKGKLMSIAISNKVLVMFHPDYYQGWHLAKWLAIDKPCLLQKNWVVML